MELSVSDWWHGRNGHRNSGRYRWVEPDRDNRTKEEWPYSYSDHYLWGNPIKSDHAVYSDRLHQWSLEKWERAWAAVGKKRFDQFSPNDADQFMSAYEGERIKVSALAEGCNVGNGYPYWILWFHQVDKSEST